MGKNLQHVSLISLDHHNPGCIKGIFHHFNHRKWYNVKKRLPYKRNHGGKNATVVEGPVCRLHTTDADEVREKTEPESAKSSTHGKSSESGSGHKTSMKSRIKAWIPEELYKRRGRHYRTSSCPPQMPVDRAPSIHQINVSALDPCAETGLRNESLDQKDNSHSLVSSLLDPLLPRISGESVTTGKTCHLCAARLTNNYLRQSEVNEPGKQPMKDHTLLHNELVYAIEPSKIASLQESKLFFDALDPLNIRKELFLKVLQDPNSSLSHHLHNQRATTSRSGLTKSVSFPMAGSSGTAVPSSNSRQSKKEGGSRTEEETKPQVCTEDMNVNAFTSSEESQENLAIETGTCAHSEALMQLFLRTDSLDNASVGSPKEFKKQQVNEFVIKRFKNLREKIKHAIKESRKERQRIVMDGFLHKIPYGYRKNIKEDKLPSALGNSGADGIRRTSSFNESSSAYHKLIESQFNKETNNHISGRSKLRTAGGSPALLARIHSLPDMRSYSFSRIERSPTTDSSEISKRPSLSGSLNSENSSLVNKKLVALKNQITSGDSFENYCHEKIQEFDESQNDLGSSKRRESIADQDNSIEPISDFVHDSKMEDVTALSFAVEDSVLAQEADLPAEDQFFNKDDSSTNQQREFSMDSPGSFENRIKVNETDTPFRQSYNDLLRVQVDMKNRADFNFVREVLELSGFSGTEFLGKWHSMEQPVDPLVFDQVEGYPLAQPNCSGNAEGGSCNHLLLFDLINEVLLEIYGRTFSYWPKPLTCCSHVHPMPVGYHVLEDVWASINWYLRRRSEVDPSFDDAVNHDLSKSDGWMNIQFEAECVGIELEDWIFDDLLDELVFS